MSTPLSEPEVAPHPDEVNRLWQHGLHEEKLFYDRLNYFSAIQVGLLGVFAILYHKEPSVGVFVPLTAAALAFSRRRGPASACGDRIAKGTASQLIPAFASQPGSGLPLATAAGPDPYPCSGNAATASAS